MPDVKYIPISGRNNFIEIFTNGKKFFGNNSRAVVCFKKKSEYDGVVRYAIAVSKRVSKKATVRNRIKRLLRESLKQTDYHYLFCIDRIIINWNSAPAMPSLISLKDILPEISGLIRKINTFANNIQEKEETESNI